jgi:uncharacterized protein YkwD
MRFVFVVLLSFWPFVAQACEKPEDIYGDRALANAQNFDHALFNKTLLQEVNYTRCLHGAKPLIYNRKLESMAKKHSLWMSQTGVFSHESTKSGFETLSDRALEERIRGLMVTENLAKVSWYMLDVVGRFEVVDEKKCVFRTLSGQNIGRHTYRSLARYSVHSWLGSPGHRENLLDPSLDEHGVGVVFDVQAKYCGQVYITQNFLQKLK